LREVLAAKSERIGVEESSDKGTINVPLDILRGPIDRVHAEGLDRSAYWVVNSTIVGGGVTLAEEIALHGGVG